MAKGKNFSCNNLGQRKKSDFYETPYSLVWQLMQTQCFGSYWYTHPILEPACGNGAIVKALIDSDKRCEEMITATDINKGDNFLDRDEKEIVKYPNVPELDSDKWPLIITNPPFSLADEFIKKAKKISNEFAFLLPLSYLHGKKRFDTIYNDNDFPLRYVYVFTRYPMLGDPLRPDGKYRTGMMVYAWFIWERKPVVGKGLVLYSEPKIRWLDNNEYVLNKGDSK